MKIRCDVCEKEKATVFCSADEAALCKDCDRRVHCANKLAGKHARYSLLHPNFKDSPLCDVCQDRKALLFCQEDRAILCRECDIPIHRANELTQKHNRFLLTGVRLSPSSSSSSSAAAAAAIHHQQPLASSPSTSGLWSQGSSSPPNHPEGLVNPTFEAGQGYGGSQEEENRAVVGGGCEGSMSTSSISEYLMETLPGWRVDEFLDSHQLGGHHHQHHHHHHHGYKNNNNSSISHGYCKTSDHALPIPDYDFRGETSSSSSASRDLAAPVPQFFNQPQNYLDFSLQYGASQGQFQPQASFLDDVDQEQQKGRNAKSSMRGGESWFHGSQFSQGIHKFAL